MLRCTAVVSAICTFALPAAADSAVAALAAPGDCAQPSADVETPPLYEQAAGVAGPVSEHFTPKVSVLGLLPLDLSRTATATVGGAASLVEGVAEATADGVSGTVEGTGDAVGEAVDGIGSGVAGAAGGVGDALGADGLGAVAGGAAGALGSDGLTGDALGSDGLTGSVTGAVDTLTDTATGTTGVLGGLK